MGTGAEVEIRLDGKTYRTFYHCGGHHDEIGKQLWFLLGGLKKDQWKLLEKKLRTHVTWVQERDWANEEIQKMYGSMYTRKQSEYKQWPAIKDVLARIHNYPGYALNMVLHDKLHHMMHVNCEDAPEDEADAIFDHAEFTYAVDLPTRSLKILDEQREGKYVWITVPFLRSSQLRALNTFKVFNGAKRTRELLVEGPDY